jgi:hypothetical protein
MIRAPATSGPAGRGLWGKAKAIETCMLPDMNKTSERRYLVFGANTAHTPDQIVTMREVLATWLIRHPDDEIVKRAARRLDRYEDRLRQAGEWH